jgi:hypothetical protein
MQDQRLKHVADFDAAGVGADQVSESGRREFQIANSASGDMR